MNTSPNQENLLPPNILTVLRAGFDTAANHIYLILFPAVMDLLIWLGPHVQLKTLLSALFAEIQNTIANPPPQLADQTQLWTDPENAQAIKLAQSFLVERFNLMAFLRSFPVGIPSFMSGKYPVGSPLGSYPVLDLTDPGLIMGFWLLFSCVGLVVGILFYQLTAQAALNGKVTWRQAFQKWPGQAVRSLGLGFLMVVLIGASAVPFFCLALVSLGSLSMLSSVLYSGLLIVVLYPFVFSGHAIAADDLTLREAAKTTFRLSRMTMPITSLFFLILFLITRAMEWLWAAPAENSWLTLIAIIGHAFVTTGLLAASFIFYRKVNNWLQTALRVLS